jgi:Tfp pilus assembly protein PilW
MTKGSTLIELLIYLALLSLLVIGVFSSVYMTIHIEEKESKNMEEDSLLILKTYY